MHTDKHYPVIDEFIAYFDENHKIKDDAPDEYKIINHLTKIYTLSNMIETTSIYIKDHPKIIDIKISDITEIMLRFYKESVKDMTAELQNLQDKTSRQIEELEKSKKEKMYE